MPVQHLGVATSHDFGRSLQGSPGIGGPGAKISVRIPVRIPAISISAAHPLIYSLAVTDVLGLRGSLLLDPAAVAVLTGYGH
jgi:hypothetical protein